MPESIISVRVRIIDERERQKKKKKTKTEINKGAMASYSKSVRAK